MASGELRNSPQGSAIQLAKEAREKAAADVIRARELASVRAAQKAQAKPQRSSDCFLEVRKSQRVSRVKQVLPEVVVTSNPSTTCQWKRGTSTRTS